MIAYYHTGLGPGRVWSEFVWVGRVGSSRVDPRPTLLVQVSQDVVLRMLRTHVIGLRCRTKLTLTPINEQLNEHESRRSSDRVTSSVTCSAQRPTSRQRPCQLDAPTWQPLPPDGTTLLPCAIGKPMAWDVTVADTYAESHLAATTLAAGAAADKAAAINKEMKYRPITIFYDWHCCINR